MTSKRQRDWLGLVSDSTIGSERARGIYEFKNNHSSQSNQDGRTNTLKGRWLDDTSVFFAASSVLSATFNSLSPHTEYKAQDYLQLNGHTETNWRNGYLLFGGCRSKAFSLSIQLIYSAVRSSLGPATRRNVRNSHGFSPLGLNGIDSFLSWNSTFAVSIFSSVVIFLLYYSVHSLLFPSIHYIFFSAYHALFTFVIRSSDSVSSSVWPTQAELHLMFIPTFQSQRNSGFCLLWMSIGQLHAIINGNRPKNLMTTLWVTHNILHCINKLLIANTRTSKTRLVREI